MSRYIDAETLVRWICGNKCGCERNECGYDIPCQQVQLLEGAPTIHTKQIKYYDEDEQVWKIGEVIVDE